MFYMLLLPSLFILGGGLFLSLQIIGVFGQSGELGGGLTSRQRRGLLIAIIALFSISLPLALEGGMLDICQNVGGLRAACFQVMRWLRFPALLSIAVMFGLLAMLVIEMFTRSDFWSRQSLKELWPLWALLGAFLVVVSLGSGFYFLVIPLFVVFAVLAWLAWDWRGWPGVLGRALSLLVMAGYLYVVIDLFLFNPAYSRPGNPLLYLPSLTRYFLGPAAVVMASGHLLYAAAAGKPRPNPLARAAQLLLGAGLMSIISLQFMTEHMRDQMSDGLSSAVLIMVVPLAAVAGSALLSYTRPGRASRIAGVGLLLAAIGALALGIQLTSFGNAVEISEQRATAISRALDEYYQAQGRYPASLDELTPDQLLFLPRPLLFHGQDWCYSGGQDAYRLGYAFHIGFSAPESVKISSEAGELDESQWSCNIPH